MYSTRQRQPPYEKGDCATTLVKGGLCGGLLMSQKELWGLEAISAYMGWRDPQAPLRALDQEGF